MWLEVVRSRLNTVIRSNSLRRAADTDRRVLYRQSPRCRRTGRNSGPGLGSPQVRTSPTSLPLLFGTCTFNLVHLQYDMALKVAQDWYRRLESATAQERCRADPTDARGDTKPEL
jgi:hypothetical protein